MLTVIKRSFSVPKLGSQESENEDAYEIYQSRGSNRRNMCLRCAISDGATQASFSSLWAKLLVRQVVRYVPSRKRLGEITEIAQIAWSKEIATKNLPWHAEEKVKKGAFASLLWLSIKRTCLPNNIKGTWKGIAIGDSNLFLFRENKLVCAFPIEHSTEFGNSPVLLSSISSRNQQINPFIKTIQGNWLPGDEFLLATDALAHYILKQVEVEKNPLPDLKNQMIYSENYQSLFADWIYSLRQANMIRNDDTTLLWFRVEDHDELFEDINANRLANN